MTSSEASPRSYPFVAVERNGYVTTVTIDRPGTKNACTGDMWVALGATFRDLSYSGARAIDEDEQDSGQYCRGGSRAGSDSRQCDKHRLTDTDPSG